MKSKAVLMLNNNIRRGFITLSSAGFSFAASLENKFDI